MDKVIIRKKVISGINTEIIRLSKDNESIEKTIHRLGKEKILKFIFKEDENYNSLYLEYENFRGGRESKYFSWMYLLTPKYGVVLDSNIYIYKISDITMNNPSLDIPWYYAESKKYMGDTWWSDDLEILSDLKSLNVIDFIEKYKGI